MINRFKSFKGRGVLTTLKESRYLSPRLKEAGGDPEGPLLRVAERQLSQNPNCCHETTVMADRNMLKSRPRETVGFFFNII
jgi:hypothetical protein